MQEVNVEEARRLLGALCEACEEFRRAYNKLPFFKKIYYFFRKFPQREGAQLVVVQGSQGYFEKVCSVHIVLMESLKLIPNP